MRKYTTQHMTRFSENGWRETDVDVEGLEPYGSPRGTAHSPVSPLQEGTDPSRRVYLAALSSIPSEPGEPGHPQQQQLVEALMQQISKPIANDEDLDRTQDVWGAGGARSARLAYTPREHEGWCLFWCNQPRLVRAGLKGPGCQMLEGGIFFLETSLPASVLLRSKIRWGSEPLQPIIYLPKDWGGFCRFYHPLFHLWEIQN